MNKSHKTLITVIIVTILVYLLASDIDIISNIIHTVTKNLVSSIEFILIIVVIVVTVKFMKGKKK